MIGLLDGVAAVALKSSVRGAEEPARHAAYKSKMAELSEGNEA